MKRKYTEVKESSASSSEYDSEGEDDIATPSYDEARELVLATAKLPIQFIRNAYCVIQVLEGREVEPEEADYEMDMIKINICTFREVKSYVDSCQYLYAAKNHSIDLDMHAFTDSSMTDKKSKVVDRIEKIRNLVIGQKRMKKIAMKKKLAKSKSSYPGQK